MTGTAHVRRAKRALAVARDAEDGRVAGMALAVELDGVPRLLATASLGRAVAAGRCRLVRQPAPALLALDDEDGLSVLSLPEGSTLSPLTALAVAPVEDGEALLATGAGLTVPVGAGQVRHLWVTRGLRLAGRLHAFDEGARAEEFRYLVDLPPDALPPGSALLREADGALVGLLSGAPAPGPGLSLALPLRDAVVLAERLSSRTGPAELP